MTIIFQIEKFVEEWDGSKDVQMSKTTQTHTQVCKNNETVVQYLNKLL